SVHLIMCLDRVDHQCLIQARGYGNLLSKPRQLLRQGSPQAIQAALANANAACWAPREQALQLIEILHPMLTNKPGVDPQAIPEPFLRRRQGHYPAPITAAHTRYNQPEHASCGCFSQLLPPNPVKPGEVEMTVGVKEPHSNLRRLRASAPASCETRYPDSVPAPDSD